MTILLRTLAVTFAGSCVWLTVRIVNRKERWAKWTLAAAVGLPVLYIASFGPWCWAFSRWGDIDGGIRASIFHPLVKMWIKANADSRFSIAINWYANAFANCHIGPGRDGSGYVIINYD